MFNRRCTSVPSALPFIPREHSLSALRAAAAGCRGCHLFERATQTVFGEGARHAKAVLVGEQPGNDEDLEGRPFLGPAGKLLDRALEEGNNEALHSAVTGIVDLAKHSPLDGAGDLSKLSAAFVDPNTIYDL